MKTARMLRPNACLDDPRLDVMNFLNEAVARFPLAISFAPGRPCDALVDIETQLRLLPRFVAQLAVNESCHPTEAWLALGQYGRTKGLINDAIATHLACDEGIDVSPDSIVVTVGAQEAMALVLVGLFEPGRDVLLVSDPSYVGITGLARLLGIRTVAVPARDHGVNPDDLERAIGVAGRDGCARAFYDVPDFNNPLGTSLCLEARQRLLRVCRRHDVLVIEDNPYGMFAYDHPRQPTLKALDADGTVLYIGSFAKTLCPGLRVGYVVADQPVVPDGKPLADVLSRVKSLLTVNTSPLAQAVVASVLMENGGSLEPSVATKRARYKRHRDAMAAALERHFGRSGDAGVSWSLPTGGFFFSLSLPFEFGEAELERCGRNHGVIACPMRYFCADDSRDTQVRLSFSAVDEEQIDRGIARLARFADVRTRVAS